MKNINFITTQHNSVKRNYKERVIKFDKYECSKIASKFNFHYWDGDKKYGYGGYKYDGRWKKIAKKIINYYNIKNDAKILDIGCGKGYLLYEFKKLLPECQVFGVDISPYAISKSFGNIKKSIYQGCASKLPFKKNYFDLVISINTLHNLNLNKLISSLNEINRVSKKSSWINIESYRNNSEKINLLYWQLTCNSFYSVEDWLKIFQISKYKGDYGFIFFR